MPVIPTKLCMSFLLSLLFIGCSNREASAPKPETMEEAFSKLRECAPKNEPKKNLSLAVKSVELEPLAMKVRIVASALSEPVDFDLPVYRLSSGRWVINGTGRAYVISEDCREYRLKGRKSVDGYEIPVEGRIRLKPEQKFEALLVFPRPPERARVGMLVYDGQTLPFMLRVEPR